MYRTTVTQPEDGAAPSTLIACALEAGSRLQSTLMGASSSPEATGLVDDVCPDVAVPGDCAVQGDGVSAAASLPVGTDSFAAAAEADTAAVEADPASEFASTTEPATGDGARAGGEADAVDEVAEVPQGDPAAIAALEALLFGADDEALAKDADGFFMKGLFDGILDHDLVSSLNIHAIRGAQDALLLARIAVLYRRGSMNPVNASDLGPTGRPGTRAPEGRSTEARQARHAFEEAQKAHAKEVRAKTARVRAGGVRALTREELTVMEVIARLQVSKHAAQRLVAIANALSTRLPHTMLALRAGRLDYRRVQIVEDRFTPLLDDHYARARRAGLSPAEASKAARNTGRALEEYVYPTIFDAHPCTVHQVCAGAVLMIDPEFVERTRQEKIADRFLTYRKDGDTGEIYAKLGAVEAQGIFNVVDAYGAPRSASLYTRRSREKLGRRFLGPMAYLNPKGAGDRSLPGKQRSRSGV